MKSPGIAGLAFSFLLIGLCMVVTPVSAQYRELGFGLGGMSYTGDLIRNYDFSANRIGGTVYYRRNITRPVSIRYSLLAGKLAGNDNDPIDVAAQLRGASFDIFVLELSVILEYYFLDIRSRESQYNWSPYFFAGIGVFRMFGLEEKVTDYSSVQPAIPFGVGTIFVLSDRYKLGVEFGARKLFTDFMDNISGGDPTIKNFQYGNKNDRDWYYFVGLSLSYTLYSVPCYYRFY